MKQINLAPHYYQINKGASIHPFWKHFVVITLILTFLSLGFPIYYHIVLVDYRASLARMEHRALELKPMSDQFTQTATTRRLLQEEIQLLKSQMTSDQLDNSLYTESHPKITQTLQAVIESMPDDVWLHKIDCDYTMQTVILTGSTISKEVFQTFLDNGLMKKEILDNFSIQNLRWVENPKELQFQISIDFLHKADQEPNSGE